jgi:hypothetical protein
VLLIAFYWSQAVSAIDVRPPHLTQMIGISDLVASGRISEVREQSLLVQVDEILAGATTEGALEVAQPKRWPDEPRWAPYAPGQRVVLFLREALPNAATDDPKWSFEGPSGRGELPIDGKYVYLPERYEGLGEAESVRVHGAAVEFQKIELAHFISAVSEYSECFTWERGDQGSAPKVKQICDDVILDEYASRSSLHLHLVEESRSFSSRRLEP